MAWFWNSHYQVGPSWPWSYGSWIYIYLCNQYLSRLMLWARISIRARCTTLCDRACQWLVRGRRFSPGLPVSSMNKTDHHDMAEILLKVALNPIKQTNKKQTFIRYTQSWLKLVIKAIFARTYDKKSFQNIRISSHWTIWNKLWLKLSFYNINSPHPFEKKVLKVMIINSNNIIKTNNHLSS